MIRSPLRAALAASVALAPLMAHAQMAPAEFLAEMEQLYSAQGIELTNSGTEDQSGTLVVRDLVAEGGLDGWIFSIAFGDMYIAPTTAAGYDLEVTQSETATMTISMSDDIVTMDMTGTFTSQGMYWVGGPADDRTFEVAYPELALDLSSTVLVDGETVEQTFAFDFQDLSGLGGYSLANAETSFDLAAGLVNARVSAVPPEGDGTIDYSGTYVGTRFVGTAPIVDMGSATFNGMQESSTEVSFESSDTVLAWDVDGESGGFTLISSDGFFDLSTGNGQIDYGYVFENVGLRVNASTLPLPSVSADMEKLELRLAIPLAPSEDPQRLALKVALEALNIDGALWSLVDPGGSLPREPGNLLIDITSTARALVDMSTIGDNPQALMGGFPIELDDVTLNALNVDLAGVSVTGSGAAEMNNDGFIPMPVGGVDLEVMGLTGLLGKLTEMGLLQQGQVMPVQMMLGMFAKPGSAPDSFTSRIEMTADGGITANGIPLQ